MPLPTSYPTDPKPSEVRQVDFDRKAIDVEFGRVVRQSRAKGAVALRRYALEYEGLNRAKLDVLVDFFAARKGPTERFDFTSPVPEETVAFPARFAADSSELAWEQTGAFDYKVAVEIEEAP